MIGWFYNANVRILQTEDFFVVNGEMLPPRIIPLAEDYTTPGVVRWEGESVATWEGDTLVVYSDRFRPEVSWFFLRTSDKQGH